MRTTAKTLGRRVASNDGGAAPYKLFLPLWRQVIFIDWFGVLTTDLFWHSILGNQGHPYHARVSNVTGNLFSKQRERVRAWMRGELDAANIVSELKLQLDGRAKDDYLLRRLFEDCRTVSVRGELLQEIRRIAGGAFIIIATDNMDCFADQVGSMRNVTRLVDDVLISSNLGRLKVENIHEFLEPWLRHHSLNFKQSILIDDNPRICGAFRETGGQAVIFKDVPQAIEDLRICLESQGDLTGG